MTKLFECIVLNTCHLSLTTVFSIMKVWIAAILIIILHACILWHSIQKKSASVDELSHLAAGLYSLTIGDFRMNRTAPPLQNIICALPVILTTDYQLNYDNESWRKGIWNGSGDRLLEANPQTFHHILMTGRIGSILLSCLLCLIVFIWSKEIWGNAPALFVLWVTAFEPNLMAHGRLATTDMAPVLCFTLTGYALWRYAKNPSWLWLLIIGLCVGLAWYAKHSGVVLLPALFLCFVYLAFASPHRMVLMFPFISNWNAAVQKIIIPLASLVVILTVGLFVIWAGYGFEVGDSIEEVRTPNQSYIWSGIEVPLRTMCNLIGYDDPSVINSLDPNQPLWVFLRNYLPAFSHWEGYFANRAHLLTGHLGYFMGELSSQGWKAYYPVLFLIKTPTGLLALLALGALLLNVRLVKLDVKVYISLGWIPLIYLLVIVFFNTANIGYRHALLVIPFMLILFAGASFRFMLDYINVLRNRSDEGKVNHHQKPSKSIYLCIVGMIPICVIVQTASVLSQHPHYLSYFNSLIGGPHNGHYYAVDSNLDWGQDLLYIKEYIEVKNIPDARLLYFGPPSLLPAYKVPYTDARKLAAFDSGTYIISATLLHGIGAGELMPRLSVFLTREPDEYITPAVFVYRIP